MHDWLLLPPETRTRCWRCSPCLYSVVRTRPACLSGNVNKGWGSSEMTLPNEHPQLKQWVSSFVKFRNKCCRHELSTARAKTGQLLAPVESFPQPPPQRHRAGCQTLWYQAWHPAARRSLLPWACLPLGGCGPRNCMLLSRCGAVSNGSAAGSGAANIYSHSLHPLLPGGPQAQSHQSLACVQTWPARRGQVMRIKLNVFAYPQHREGN